jgi:uroporphyrin-3 C-methyltransferase
VTDPVDPPAPIASPVASPVAAQPAASLRSARAERAAQGRWIAAGAVVLAVLSTAALVFAWNSQQRLKTLEAELVKRQLESSAQAAAAGTLARQAEQATRDGAAKLALLEARVAETSLQRSQLEELIQSLARSRDENVLADVEASIRVALQQSAITGNADPLVLTLKQADERLARYNQPRLERVRRAVTQDLERTRTTGVTDVTVLTIRIDDVIRQIDDLPLVSAPERRAAARAAEAASAAERPASAIDWAQQWGQRWQGLGSTLWQEIKSLIRVSRIEQPEAALVAPEQAFFLRENLKLRLLNARLALLSRQFDSARSDLRDAHVSLNRYFDPGSRRVVQAGETLHQLSEQARLVNVPRPDATLAAIAAAAAGR